MADPLSIAGLGLSAVSLTFQIFSGCVKGYTLLSNARGMPEQYQYLRVRLKTEQYRLLNWARIANLSEQESTMCATLRLNESLLQEVLRETDTILSSFWKIDRPYRRLVVEEEAPGERLANSDWMNSSSSWQDAVTTSKPFKERFPHGDGSLESKALKYAQKLRGYPARIRWAAFDFQRFEKLLAQLSTLNDFMQGLLNSDQQFALHQEQLQTSMQILQLNNKIDHLLQIVKATSMELSVEAPLSERLHYLQLNSQVRERYTDITDLNDRSTLSSLASFKALNTAIEFDNLDPESAAAIRSSDRFSNVVDPRLDPKSCTIFRPSHAGYLTEIERSEGLYAGEPVWVEWKYYDPRPEDGQCDPSIWQRITKLAVMLHDANKPEGFHVPRCLGYFNDWEREQQHYRIGFVFRRPEGISSACLLTSLFEMLLDEERPSLSDRVRLAKVLVSSVQYLHSTNWIHKGLRSRNVVFFHEPGRVDLSHPYICGFGLARPAQRQEMTEQPDSNPLYNLYRHPLAHGDVMTGGIGGFKKIFDIYSLGVILMEIALWQPMHEILGIQNIESSLKPGLTRKVRSKLLHEKQYLMMVHAAVGDIFADVVRTCLEGDFGIDLECEGREEEAIKLQKTFQARVILPLNNIFV